MSFSDIGPIYCVDNRIIQDMELGGQYYVFTFCSVVLYEYDSYSVAKFNAHLRVQMMEQVRNENGMRFLNQIKSLGEEYKTEEQKDRKGTKFVLEMTRKL